jgi:asparagine synthetase B (glutamine-hydrolysing)
LTVRDWPRSWSSGPLAPPGHGVFRGVEELRPGHYPVHTRRATTTGRYWSLESRPHEDDPETTTAKVRWLLEDTVGRQLVADVPVCTLLSGGLDSSAVTAFAAGEFERAGMGRLHTWSIDYEGNSRNFQPNRFQPDEDAPWARRVSDLFSTHLNITRFMPTLLDRKDRMSMAVGLEVRVPYWEHRLVEYVWNVPWRMKSADGREKGLLRRAPAGVSPDDVLYRRKNPYPKTHNPAYHGAGIRDNACLRAVRGRSEGRSRAVRGPFEGGQRGASGT